MVSEADADEAPPAYEVPSIQDFLLLPGNISAAALAADVAAADSSDATIDVLYKANHPKKHGLPAGATVLDGGATCNITTTLLNCGNLRDHKEVISVGDDHKITVTKLVDKVFPCCITGGDKR